MPRLMKKLNEQKPNGFTDRNIGCYLAAIKSSGRCWYCSKILNRREVEKQPRADWPNLEHQTPKKHGGALDLDNLVMACARCNQIKSTNNLIEYRDVIIGGFTSVYKAVGNDRKVFFGDAQKDQTEINFSICVEPKIKDKVFYWPGWFQSAELPGDWPVYTNHVPLTPDEVIKRTTENVDLLMQAHVLRKKYGIMDRNYWEGLETSRQLLYVWEFWYKWKAAYKPKMLFNHWFLVSNFKSTGLIFGSLGVILSLSEFKEIEAVDFSSIKNRLDSGWIPLPGPLFTEWEHHSIEMGFPNA
jgi:hypothetical protein